LRASAEAAARPAVPGPMSGPAQPDGRPPRLVAGATIAADGEIAACAALKRVPSPRVRRSRIDHVLIKSGLAYLRMLLPDLPADLSAKMPAWYNVRKNAEVRISSEQIESGGRTRRLCRIFRA